MEDSQKEKPSEIRKPYARPQLTDLGDVRDVTLGNSFGLQDSGGGVGEEQRA